MPVGRPSEYSEKTLQRAKAYLRYYAKNDEVVPSVAGLSRFLHVSRDTIYAWAKEPDKAEFSDIVEECRGEQEKILLNKGLRNEVNATIAKLALSAKHDYKEKQEVEQSGEIKVNVIKFGDGNNPTPSIPS